jgi:hypothetical protein
MNVTSVFFFKKKKKLFHSLSRRLDEEEASIIRFASLAATKAAEYVDQSMALVEPPHAPIGDQPPHLASLESYDASTEANVPMT